MSLEPLKFLVHRVSSHPLVRTVTHDGEELKAVVNSVEVELSSMEGHGTLALRYVGRRAEEARKIFVEGQVIAWPLHGISVHSDVPSPTTSDAA